MTGGQHFIILQEMVVMNCFCIKLIWKHIELESQDLSYSLYIAAFYGHVNLCKNIVDNYNLDVHKPDNDG